MYLHDAGRLGGDRGSGVPARLQVDAFTNFGEEQRGGVVSNEALGGGKIDEVS